MDPGRQAMESMQRANEAAQRGIDNARRAGEDARRAGEDARRAAEFARWSSEVGRDRRPSGRPSEHGLLASILLFPFRLIAAILRLGVIAVVIGIFVVIAYILLNGGPPF